MKKKKLKQTNASDQLVQHSQPITWLILTKQQPRTTQKINNQENY